LTDIVPIATDPERLTRALRSAGVLDKGRVRSVAVQSSTMKPRSRIVRLRLTYDGADAQAPGSVILKTALPGSAASARSMTARTEIAFYRNVTPAMSSRLVPRFFDASWASDGKLWHLLLEDLTDSHFTVTEWPLPPTMEQCQSIVEALARFHAAWWDDRRLGLSVGKWRDLDRYLRNLTTKFAWFADLYPELLGFGRRELYERLLGRAPHLLARYQSHRNLTLAHGDAHVWNCMLPRNGTRDDVRFIDWEVWHIDSATTDLAYMMALHWYPDRRRFMERSLLDLYHEKLMACGVSFYDRTALDDDYRLSVLWQMMQPVLQASYGFPASVWWNNLERILLAVEDLDCRELLA
jgi:thiamine kinase-like enzyme